MASIIKRLWSGSDFWDKEENKQQRQQYAAPRPQPEMEQKIKTARYGVLANNPQRQQQFIQDTKPTPGPSILSTVHNTINDTLNANTQADQQRRLSQGLPRYYQDQSNLSKITRAAETGGRVTARVLQGIGQDTLGAYDLLTPGHGTNRATKYYQNRGKETDQEVKDMGLDENVYKAGQVPLALGSYMIPGKAVSSAAKATQIAKVPQVVKLAGTLNKVPGVTKTIGALDDLAANGDRFQRITANLARSYTRPGNIADVGVDALQNAGHRTSLGQDNSAGTLALDAGMSLGMQGGMNLAGQGASAGIRAANAGIVQPTTRLVRNVANTVAPVQTTTKLIPRTGRLDLATSDALKAYNNMLVGADPNIQGKVQSDLIARIQQIGKENGVDLTNGSVEQRMARVEAMLNGYLPQAQTGRQFVGKPLGEGGYAKNPFYRGDDVAGGLSKEQSEFINDYANMLEGMGAGNGVDITPDGRRISNNVRDASTAGKTMSKQDWFDKARKDIESGKAGFGASDDYKKLPGAPKTDPLESLKQEAKRLGYDKGYTEEGQIANTIDELMKEQNAVREVGIPLYDKYKNKLDGTKTVTEMMTPAELKAYRAAEAKSEKASKLLKDYFDYKKGNSQSQPPKSTPKAEAPDPLESLKQEARKYKSAEEFTKAIQDGKVEIPKGSPETIAKLQKELGMNWDSAYKTPDGVANMQKKVIADLYNQATQSQPPKSTPVQKVDPLESLKQEARTTEPIFERDINTGKMKMQSSKQASKEKYSIANSDISRTKNPGMNQDGFTVEDWGGKKRFVSLDDASPETKMKVRKAEAEFERAKANSTGVVAPGTKGPVQIAREKLNDAYSDAIDDLKLQDYATTENGGRTFNSKYNDWLETKYKDRNIDSATIKDMATNPQKYRSQFEAETATQSQPPKSTPVQKQAPQPTKVATPFEKDLQAVGLAPKNTKPGLESRTPKKSLKTPQEKPVVSGTSRKLSTPEVKQPQNLQQPSTTASAGVGGQAVSKTQPEAYKQPKESQVSQNQVQSQESSSKTRGFIKSVLEDPNTNPKVKESISSLYTVRNTKELQTKAATLVKEHPDIAEQMSKSANDDASVAVAMELVKKHQNAGDYTRAIDLVESVAKDLTEAGRTVQAASIYGRLTPEGILRFTQKEINNYNKATGKDIKLTPKAADTLKTMADDLQKMPDGYDKDVAVAKMIAEVQKTMPATTAEKISTFQTMAQLLNPKTIIRNELGNSAFLGLENISQTVATPVDALMSLFTGKRTTTLPSVKTQVKGLIEGRKKGVSEAFQGINTGASTQYDLNSVPVFRGKVLGNLEKTMGAALRGGDRANYTAAFDDSLKGSMKLAKTKTATPEMLEAAHHAGLYRTFQDQNVISNFFVGMKKTLNTVGIGIKGKRFGLGDMVLKYPKTPANLLARGIDYSPAGFVKTVFEMSKPLFGKQFDQKVFVDSLSRATTGTAGLVGTGAMLGSLGIITEAPEKDKDLRDLQKQSGLGGYQINVSGLKRFVASGFSKDAAKLREGDKLVSYDWAQPAAIPVSMGAAIGKGKGAKEGAGKSVSALTEGIQTITEQPMVRGLQQFFGSNKGAGGIVGDLLKDTPASFIPTLSNQVRQLTDNTNRNTYDPSVLTESMNRVKNKIPGLASSVPARIGSLGETRENYQNGSNNPFNVFFNPSFVSNYDPKETAKLPLGINQRTGEVKQAPRSISTTQTVNGKSVKITAQQNQDLQKYVGTETDKAFSQLMKNPAFMALSDEEKANKMGTLITNINKAGKVLILGDEGYGTDSYNPTKLDRGVRDVLGGKYDYSTRSMKTGAASSDYAQQYADLKADFNDPNNGWSDVQKVAKTKELKRLEIKKDYDADTVALHSMSKADMYAYVSKAKNGKQLAEKLIAYDNALYEAGLSQYRKYKNGIAPASKGGGRKSGGRGGKRKAIPKDLMAKAMDVPKVAQLRQSKITAKQPQARSFKTRRKAIPKIAKSTPKLMVKRTQTA